MLEHEFESEFESDLISAAIGSPSPEFVEACERITREVADRETFVRDGMKNGSYSTKRAADRAVGARAVAGCGVAGGIVGKGVVAGLLPCFPFLGAVAVGCIAVAHVRINDQSDSASKTISEHHPDTGD